MQGKYGPLGELLIFLIQKEQAVAPSNEIFSPFINPGIRFPCFSADVRKKCALIALHAVAEEAMGGDGFQQVPELMEEWKMVCQKCVGRKAMLGRKTKVCSQVALGKAMCATMRCTSLGCMDPVARSLFSCRIGSWQMWRQAGTWPWTCCAGK